jgi:hypothetical protein
MHKETLPIPTKPSKTMTDLLQVVNTCTRAASAMLTVKMEKHAESGGCFVALASVV